jgi:hypothetical protein
MNTTSKVANSGRRATKSEAMPPCLSSHTHPAAHRVGHGFGTDDTKRRDITADSLRTVEFLNQRLSGNWFSLSKTFESGSITFLRGSNARSCQASCPPCVRRTCPDQAIELSRAVRVQNGWQGEAATSIVTHNL